MCEAMNIKIKVTAAEAPSSNGLVERHNQIIADMFGNYYFYGIVDQQKVFSCISSWDLSQRSSPLWISDMQQSGLEPAQNLS